MCARFISLHIQDKKKEPPYGADVLRLWVATVDYWKDVTIGPASLAHTAEALRKIRNSARFILGNVGDGNFREVIPVSKGDLGLVSV